MTSLTYITGENSDLMVIVFRNNGHALIWIVRRDLFYLLDYVTQDGLFQISDRKKKKKKHGDI